MFAKKILITLFPFQNPLSKTKKLIGDAGISFSNAVSIISIAIVALTVVFRLIRDHLVVKKISKSVKRLSHPVLSVCCQPAVLPQPSQHPHGEIPPQPPRHQQHVRGELQQQSLAEERGGQHLPRPAEGERRLPDLLRREIS